jgi:hypothetical protein
MNARCKQNSVATPIQKIAKQHDPEYGNLLRNGTFGLGI